MEMNKMDIKNEVPECERLALLAEECTELAHAALKLRRVIEPKNNPTPVTEEEARKKLIEEVADVQCVLQQLLEIADWMQASDVIEFKMERWVSRLVEGEGEK